MGIYQVVRRGPTGRANLQDVRELRPSQIGLHENELEDMLCSRIGSVAPGAMVIGRQVRACDERGIIDVLALTRDRTLLVIEIKRDGIDGIAKSHRALGQALFYETHARHLTFEQIVEHLAHYRARYRQHLQGTGGVLDLVQEARSALLRFLGEGAPPEGTFLRGTRVMFVARGFGSAFLDALADMNGRGDGRAHDLACMRFTLICGAPDAPMIRFEPVAPDARVGTGASQRAQSSGRTNRRTRRLERRGGREEARHRLVYADGREEGDLPLCRLVLRTIHACHEAGMSYSEILEVWREVRARRSDDILVCLPGHLHGAALRNAIEARRVAEGATESYGRRFPAREDVLIEGGNTLALTTEWRRPDAVPFINRLIARLAASGRPVISHWEVERVLGRGVQDLQERAATGDLPAAA